MSRVAVVIWTILRVAAAVLLMGWASLHLRRLDGVIGVGCRNGSSRRGWYCFWSGESLALDGRQFVSGALPCQEITMQDQTASSD
jgi:hypothetical protein